MSATHSPLPDSYESLFSRAESLIQAGDIESGISIHYRLVERLNRLSAKVLQRRPDLRDMHRQARLNLSALLRLQGRYAEAIEVAEVLLETHPDETDVWLTDLAILRVAKGEVDKGLAELKSLAEKHPDEPDRWLVLGNESRIEGRLEESQVALDRALVAAGPSDSEALAEAHYQRFQLFKALGELDNAAASWQAAYETDERVGTTIREVYTMFLDAGRYGEAERYISRDTNPLQKTFYRGQLAQLTGNPGKARQEWQAAADLNPDDYEYGHDCWVEAQLRLGDSESALSWLQESLRQHGTPRLFVLSGIGWAMRKDTEVAGALFQQAINLQRWTRPPKQKLDGSDWRLLNELVSDDEVKAPLKSYFAIVETLWG
jgi:tetratricopeptide (TPR) repeat protein